MKKEPKQKMNYSSMDSLQPVINVLNEAAITLGDSTRTIKDSPLLEVLTATLGAGTGTGVSFMAIYGLGTVGLSAVGITTALATAGSIVGGGMAAGVLVLAAPVAGLAGIGILAAKQIKKKQLRQEKQRIYKEAKEKYSSIKKKSVEAANDNKVTQERKDILRGLSILLDKIVQELEADLLM